MPSTLGRPRLPVKPQPDLPRWSLSSGKHLGKATRNGSRERGLEARTGLAVRCTPPGTACRFQGNGEATSECGGLFALRQAEGTSAPVRHSHVLAVIDS